MLTDPIRDNVLFDVWRKVAKSDIYAETDNIVEATIDVERYALDSLALFIISPHLTIKSDKGTRYAY